MTEREELIRQGYDAWNRGDWERMEQLLAPEFEIDATDRVLNPDSYRGIEGFRRLVWTLRDGKGVKLALFVDRGSALAAAGLSE